MIYLSPIALYNSTITKKKTVEVVYIPSLFCLWIASPKEEYKCHKGGKTYPDVTCGIQSGAPNVLAAFVPTCSTLALMSPMSPI